MSEDLRARRRELTKRIAKNRAAFKRHEANARTWRMRALDAARWAIEARSQVFNDEHERRSIVERLAGLQTSD